MKKILHSHFDNIRIDGIFYDGTELFDYVSTHCVDIIITDISMPGRPWTDSCEYIKASSANTHIILITAYRDFEYAKTAVNNHVDYLLTKPFQSSSLVEAITSICGKIEKRVEKDIESSKKLLKNWSILRNSLIDIYNSDSADTKYAENFFETMKGTELSGYKIFELEYTFNNDFPATISIEQAARDFGEYDSDNCSVLLLEANKRIMFICISEDSLPESFSKEFVKSFFMHTDIELTLSIRSYDNIFEWSRIKQYNNISQKTFEYILNENLNLAHAYLKTVSRSIGSENIKSLYSHLLSFLQSNGIILDARKPDTNDIAEIKKQLCDIPYSIAEKGSDSLIILKAAEFIKKNYSDCNLSLNSVAEAIDISESHLSKMFKKELSMNFTSYLLNVRMEKAKQLLRNTDISISEICSMVGYNYPTYFRKIFNNFTGMSPTQYRNKN